MITNPYDEVDEKIKGLQEKRIGTLEQALQQMSEEEQRSHMRFFLNGLGFYSSSDVPEGGMTLGPEEQTRYLELQLLHLKALVEERPFINYVLVTLERLEMRGEAAAVKGIYEFYLGVLKQHWERSMYT